MDSRVESSVVITERQVNSANSQLSMDRIADVLASVRRKGVRLWSENGRLHYKASKGALTREEIDRLRVSRGQIVALLEAATGAEGAEPRLEPCPRLNCAPLAFSQLARWNLHRLNERRPMRSIASATRMRGRLNVAALRASVVETVHRHDALRTRIVVLDGVPVQVISESDNCELKVDDLTELSESFREIEVQKFIEQLILEAVDVAVGPLLGIRLLRLRDDEHVLIITMEHMISDMFSMNIFCRDLFTAYMQTLKGCVLSLPTIPVQFAGYAVWQRNAQRSWIEKHGAYWSEHLEGCQRLRFPEGQSPQTATRLGWGTVRLQIGRSMKAELREWCRLRRTTLVMSVFTAYVGLVLRWCNASDTVIQYQSDGRVSPKIENTIGFFASVLYLRIQLLEDDCFVDLMNRVVEEYCQAYGHADFSYMAAQMPQPEFTRNSVFNWIPQGSKIDFSELDGSEHAITCCPVPFSHPMAINIELDHEPSIALLDTDDEIVGRMYFPLDRFSIDTMERFARNFLVCIEALLRKPEERVNDILLL